MSSKMITYAQNIIQLYILIFMTQVLPHDLFSYPHLLGSKATLTSFLYDSLFLLMTLLPNSLQ